MESHGVIVEHNILRLGGLGGMTYAVGVGLGVGVGAGFGFSGYVTITPMSRSSASTKAEIDKNSFCFGSWSGLNIKILFCRLAVYSRKDERGQRKPHHLPRPVVPTPEGQHEFHLLLAQIGRGHGGAAKKIVGRATENVAELVNGLDVQTTRSGFVAADGLLVRVQSGREILLAPAVTRA